MPKIRILILISTGIVMLIFGTIAVMYARGYRLSLGEEQISLGPTGLLVANSEPQAAQVYVNGVLKTATDNTISLAPETYTVEIKKEGYQTWSKDITIQREAVTQIDAYLLPNAPSLTALTFSGAINPQINHDNSKIIYVVPPSEETIANEKNGLWIIESVNLPLGFNRDPRQITDGDLTEAEFEFSPDGREVLMTLGPSIFLLDVTKFTPAIERVVVTFQVEDIRAQWEEEEKQRLEAKLAPLPDEIEETLAKHTSFVRFSPDENRILYTASGSATLAEDLIDKLPGSSTQPEERSITDGNSYVYDIREDKNFKVSDAGQTLYWIPNSLNLVHPQEEGIYILDYDGTNEKKIFSSSYTYPHAYSTTSGNRLLILTSFASVNGEDNLYWLTLK